MKKRYMLVLLMLAVLVAADAGAKRPKRGFIGNASIVDLTPDALVNITGDENYAQYNLRIVSGYPVFYVEPGTRKLITLYARKNPEGPPITNLTITSANNEFDVEVLDSHWDSLENEVMAVIRLKITMPLSIEKKDYVLKFNVTSNEIMLYGYKPTPYIIIRPEAENTVKKSALWFGTFSLLGILIYRKFTVK